MAAPEYLLFVLAVALITATAAVPAAADNGPTLAETVAAREAGGQTPREIPVDPAVADYTSAKLAETWGVEVASIRLTAHNHMIDYRYKVLDADKAADLFKRQIKPQLIHQESGKVLAVPETAKVGPLRNSNMPQEGKIYWMFFGNGYNLVQAGDKVTVVIGDFRVEDLVVE